VDEKPQTKRLKIALATDDVVGELMAGGGVRFHEMGRWLTTAGHDATVFAALEREKGMCEVKLAHVRDFAKRASDFDVLVVSTFPKTFVRAIEGFKGIVVHDLICPFFFENFHSLASLPRYKRVAIETENAGVFARAAARADYFLVATPAQRDMWLGYLTAAGVFHADGGDPFDRFLIAPNGIDMKGPVERCDLADFGLPFAPTDKVVVWAGGVHPWTDAETLALAVGALVNERPDVKALFMGVTHPSRHTGDTASRRLLKMAGDLGLTDKSVFFLSWVPYAKRLGLIAHASLGVMLHPPSLETHFAYRTRILDFIAAVVPILTSPGGYMAEFVKREGVGRIVPRPTTPKSLAALVCECLDDAKWAEGCRRNIARVKDSLAWPKAIGALAGLLASKPAPKRMPTRVEAAAKVRARVFFYNLARRLR
jgi:glycosyltransferase involved in cell wall biosynthesis